MTGGLLGPAPRRVASWEASAGLDREIDRLVYKLYDLTPDEIAIVEAASA